MAAPLRYLIFLTYTIIQDSRSNMLINLNRKTRPDTVVGLLGVLCGVNLSCKLLFAPDLKNNLWWDLIKHTI